MTQGNDVAAGRAGRRFAVRGDRVNGHYKVRVAGELDLSRIGLVDREVQRAQKSDATRIMLDLDEVEFLDASGIRLLLHLERRSKGDGKRLEIRRARSPQVRRLLDLTGVNKLLPFVD
jgi:stage II sporulation protein AA (anti-sigma F factor antagonist)